MEYTVDALKQLVQARLREMGFAWESTGDLPITASTKEQLRRLHEPARRIELAARQQWIRRNLPRFLGFFANGEEVDPHQVRPVLVQVVTQRDHDLFRMARLLWSLPFSKGYGRRLRFLVMDESNGKLIGILSLQSPPLSFPARDRLYCYPEGRKTDLVNQTMDIHTLGAVPPYSRLLGGKLVALAAASNEVRAAYMERYTNRETEIQRRTLPSHLVALTTTSAFGRSSIYNRLSYRGMAIANSLGFTEGYGSFHLEELYPLFRRFLEAQGVSTRGGFGTGPRRKWQTIVRALHRLGLSRELLRHGVLREVFLFPLVNNLADYMEGRDPVPEYRDLPFADLAAYWHERWLLPRAQRVDGWHHWRNDSVASALIIDASAE